MNKEIEEMAQVIFDYVDSKQMTRVFIVNHANELAKPFLHNTGVAKALYNAGYRKTFTSDFASDTQKAYKEGYEKGFNAKLTSDFIKYAQKQAVKEFAEKLQKELPCRDYTFNGIIYSMILASSVKYVIDKLLKEYEK